MQLSGARYKSTKDIDICAYAPVMGHAWGLVEDQSRAGGVGNSKYMYIDKFLYWGATKLTSD